MDRLRIYGDRGALVYDFTNERIRSIKYGGRELEDVNVPKELVTDWRVEDDFISAVKSKGRVRPRPNFEDGVRYMRVVQAVADSRAGNEWVSIKK
jgi:predicted dehydrogenase